MSNNRSNNASHSQFKVLDIFVVGPPAVGKSTLIQKIIKPPNAFRFVDRPFKNQEYKENRNHTVFACPSKLFLKTQIGGNIWVFRFWDMPQHIK